MTFTSTKMDSLPVVSSTYLASPIPRFEMPMKSLPNAYTIINDELMCDGNPRLNMGTYSNTWMEAEGQSLISSSLIKNNAEMDVYHVTTEFQSRCVNMIARLFHARVDKTESAVGVGTVGSSEAAMLAGLAFKRKWQERRISQGKTYNNPNIVTGSNAHICWEKFSRYFEVELKKVKLKENYYVMDPLKAVEMVDENTIGIVAILGSTLNGEFEDVRLLNQLLSEKNNESGWNIPIHVDAAIGGFVAPFIYPNLEWDFRLPLVKSINVSGHKYGFVLPSVGWVVWSSKQDLPQQLVFQTNYLGSYIPTFTINFSKGSSNIIAQYYQFIRLGYQGYKNIIEKCKDNANILREGLEKMGRFEIISKDVGIPMVAFSLKEDSKYNVFEISKSLSRFGWIVPAYTMAPDAQRISVLRVVIRPDTSLPLVERLLKDIERVLKEMDAPRSRY